MPVSVNQLREARAVAEAYFRTVKIQKGVPAQQQFLGMIAGLRQQITAKTGLIIAGNVNVGVKRGIGQLKNFGVEFDVSATYNPLQRELLFGLGATYLRRNGRGGYANAEFGSFPIEVGGVVKTPIGEMKTTITNDQLFLKFEFESAEWKKFSLSVEPEIIITDLNGLVNEQMAPLAGKYTKEAGFEDDDLLKKHMLQAMTSTFAKGAGGVGFDVIAFAAVEAYRRKYPSGTELVASPVTPAEWLNHSVYVQRQPDGKYIVQHTPKSANAVDGQTTYEILLAPDGSTIAKRASRSMPTGGPYVFTQYDMNGDGDFETSAAYDNLSERQRVLRDQEYRAQFQRVFENRCFAADTEITLADGGVKSIQDIVVGDSVLAFDLEGRLQSAAVTAVYRNRALGVVRLVDGTVCTASHPFWSTHGDFTPVEELAANGGDGMRLAAGWSHPGVRHGRARGLRDAGPGSGGLGTPTSWRRYLGQVDTRRRSQAGKRPAPHVGGMVSRRKPVARGTDLAVRHA